MKWTRNCWRLTAGIAWSIKLERHNECIHVNNLNSLSFIWDKVSKQLTDRRMDEKTDNKNRQRTLSIWKPELPKLSHFYWFLFQALHKDLLREILSVCFACQVLIVDQNNRYTLTHLISDMQNHLCRTHNMLTNLFLFMNLVHV